MVTDGPCPETEEVLVGYTIVECVSFDRATEIAADLVRPGPGSQRWAAGRTTISLTSTSSGCSTAKAMARAIAEGAIALAR
ncbi:hypothetical protein [Nocardiopsis exhalans]|uniref:hypothetical protein n=1 Tax=Nocardiopsis exhalans TaxID=163604 RepID=UPI0031D030EC